MSSFLQGLQRLYSLDTLDTRLTNPSTTTPVRATVADSRPQPQHQQDALSSTGKGARGDARAQEIAARAQPSKWNTPEFYFYYLVFITVVPMMFKTVIDVSRPDHPGYKNYAHLLSPGWIPGHQVVCLGCRLICARKYLTECYDRIILMLNMLVFETIFPTSSSSLFFTLYFVEFTTTSILSPRQRRHQTKETNLLLRQMPGSDSERSLISTLRFSSSLAFTESQS